MWVVFVWSNSCIRTISTSSSIMLPTIYPPFFSQFICQSVSHRWQMISQTNQHLYTKTTIFFFLYLFSTFFPSSFRNFKFLIFKFNQSQNSDHTSLKQCLFRFHHSSHPLVSSMYKLFVVVVKFFGILASFFSVLILLVSK